ncbi:MAG TPA: hypothetical protein VFP78_19170 [Solirubrobacteraceae bacterium]|nr:hypothetical protein [Solirubrobacteraceae bacterium]
MWPPPEEPPEPPPPPPPGRPRPHGPPGRPSRRVVALAGAGGALAIAGVAAALLLGGGGSDTGPTTPGTAYDFDNDGRQEVVVGAARGFEAGGDEPVGIVVWHSGLESTEGLAIRSEDAGVPGPPLRSDRFGAALASGDFDRDGTPDLAIGVPGRDRVAVLYSPSPDNVRTKAITADDMGSPPVTRSFGFALAAADFDDDGYVDLAVGTPGTPFQRANYELGSVHIVPGGARGLDAGAARAIAAPEDSSGFGSRLAAGDLDRDGHIDLVAGSLDEPDGPNTGHIAFCLGSPEGPDSCTVANSTSEIASSALAVGDLNGDGYADVVQGDQGNEDAGEEFPNKAGEVRLWLGRDGGPSGDPVVITQASPGIPGDPEPGDAFGHDVAAGDVDGDGLDDIVVGAHGDEEHGTVTVIRGARSGYSKSAAYMLDAPGTDEGHVGGSVALLDLDDDEDNLLDLVVAREQAPSLDEAVIVYMRKGNSFEPGVALSGLNALGTADDSPLRIGR